VLAAHADLANHRETFPAADADQGDLAMLLLVLVDLQHAALELAREQAGVVTKQLVGLGAEVKALTRRAGRAEALLQELVKQAKAANTTASEQADLLDELVETVVGQREEAEGEPAAEGEEPEEESEGGDGDEEGLRALLRGGGEDDFEEELEEGEEDGEPGEETEDGKTDHGEGEVSEVVVPDGIFTQPTAARGSRPDFDHPRAA
jgi:hypothetical protein